MPARPMRCFPVRRLNALQIPGWKQLVVTNTIPLREDALGCRKIKVLSIAGLLGRAIESIHMETSVSTLFN